MYFSICFPSDFSLTYWLSTIRSNHSGSAVLDRSERIQLQEELGITPYLKKSQCVQNSSMLGHWSNGNKLIVFMHGADHVINRFVIKP